ncbi:hypothetical protein [Luteipulveratus halotolerans]|uniref:hypothetical protein n=1 Tax=Luteipulveratus halotolerans TaxID=1631356 RepID=UPI000681C7C2|nr:hypothetical protein [Luteipulveratus halotolerans]
MTDTRGANIMTVGMDLVAILLAVLLIHPISRRIPTFAIAGPLWIGAGLLVPIGIGTPTGTLLQLATGGGSPVSSEEDLAPWVFFTVYSGFAVEAVLLLAGFVLYARDRWPLALGGGRLRDGAGLTRPLQNLLGWFFVPAALGYAVISTRWSITGGGDFEDPSTAQRVFLVVNAALALAGALAYAALLRGARLRVRWLTLGFVGSAVVMSSTLTTLINVAVIARDEWGASGVTHGETLAYLFICLCALGGAIGGALRLVEEQRPSVERIGHG